MKNVSVAALAALGLVLAHPARAQVFGQFTGAETLPAGGHLFGGYVHSSQNVVGLLAQLRLSFYPSVDFGFQGGLSRHDYRNDERSVLRLGTDLKVQVVRPSAGLPVSVAVGADLGVETGDDYNVLTLGPAAVASRDFVLGESGHVTPYAAVGLAMTSFDVGSTDDTDVSVPIRLGADMRIAPEVRIVMELQAPLGDAFNDNLGLAVGVNLPF